LRIGFIGAGKVGFSLAKWLNINYNNVYAVYSRNIEDAKEMAGFSISEYYDDINELLCNCDTLFLTVNDDSIKDVVNMLIALHVENKILIHTSGLKTTDIFGKLNDKNYCYSLHPIYAFNDKYESYKNLDNIYYTLEGSDKYINEIICLFKRVKMINKNDKAKYHLASSIVSNMVCSIINIGESLYKEVGIDDINIYFPLIKNNIDNILHYGSVLALTGPIIRNDYNTVKMHLNELAGNNLIIYKMLGLNLVNMASLKNNNIDYSKLKKLLEE